MKTGLLLKSLAAILLLASSISAWVWWSETASEPVVNTPALVNSASIVEQGAYLALLGNCAGCHTARGGQAYAGGRPIDTPFGQVLSSNISSSKEHGLGLWTNAEFWRAMHHGKSRDGRLLTPAFPFENYRHISRADSDALLAFLQSQSADSSPNRPHQLRFPYNTQFALALWRKANFTAAPLSPNSSKSPEWNRGAYLARGLAHCSACHSQRNVSGGITNNGEFGAGTLDAGRWLAPSLLDAKEASLAGWSQADTLRFLSTGSNSHASAQGPMAEVVVRSTQYWKPDDLDAIASYLRDLPGQLPVPTLKPAPERSAILRRGPKVYEEHCASCHGKQGEGASDAYPALAGNRAVNLASPSNLIQIVLAGGFAPATAGHPRPFGMPPFRQTLTDTDVADVLTFLRMSWGNSAGMVGEGEVQRGR
jgi:mono/diheme cytochrome c family protein